MLTATAPQSRLGLSIVCLMFFVVVSATNRNPASKAPTAVSTNPSLASNAPSSVDRSPFPTKEPTRNPPSRGKVQVGSFNYSDDCSDARKGPNILECISASPNNRAAYIQNNQQNNHTVYFRPEVLSITTISDRLSSFSVKLELFIYWTEPAVKYDLYLLDDIPAGAQAALWSPHNFRPLQMEDFEVLVQGVDHFLGGRSFAKQYGWCSRK